MLLLDRTEWAEMKLDLLISCKLAINAVRLLLCIVVFSSRSSYIVVLWLTGRTETAIVQISRAQI